MLLWIVSYLCVYRTLKIFHITFLKLLNLQERLHTYMQDVRFEALHAVVLRINHRFYIVAIFLPKISKYQTTYRLMMIQSVISSDRLINFTESSMNKTQQMFKHMANAENFIFVSDVSLAESKC